jgi:hypothetical protein
MADQPAGSTWNYAEWQHELSAAQIGRQCHSMSKIVPPTSVHPPSPPLPPPPQSSSPPLDEQQQKLPGVVEEDEQEEEEKEDLEAQEQEEKEQELVQQQRRRRQHDGEDQEERKPGAAEHRDEVVEGSSVHSELGSIEMVVVVQQQQQEEEEEEEEENDQRQEEDERADESHHIASPAAMNSGDERDPAPEVAAAARVPSTRSSAFVCSECGKVCKSQAGLRKHTGSEVCQQIVANNRDDGPIAVESPTESLSTRKRKLSPIADDEQQPPSKRPLPDSVDDGGDRQSQQWQRQQPSIRPVSAALGQPQHQQQLPPREVPPVEHTMDEDMEEGECQMPVESMSTSVEATSVTAMLPVEAVSLPLKAGVQPTGTNHQKEGKGLQEEEEEEAEAKGAITVAARSSDEESVNQGRLLPQCTDSGVGAAAGLTAWQGVSVDTGDEVEDEDRQAAEAGLQVFDGLPPQQVEDVGTDETTTSQSTHLVAPDAGVSAQDMQASLGPARHDPHAKQRPQAWVSRRREGTGGAGPVMDSEPENVACPRDPRCTKLKKHRGACSIPKDVQSIQPHESAHDNASVKPTRVKQEIAQGPNGEKPPPPQQQHTQMRPRRERDRRQPKECVICHGIPMCPMAIRKYWRRVHCSIICWCAVRRWWNATEHNKDTLPRVKQSRKETSLAAFAVGTKRGGRSI